MAALVAVIAATCVPVCLWIDRSGRAPATIQRVSIASKELFDRAAFCSPTAVAPMWAREGVSLLLVLAWYCEIMVTALGPAVIL